MRVFLSLLLFMGMFSLSAQRTTTTTKTHQTTASNVYTNNGKIDSQSSTSNSRNSYKFNADFKANKQLSVKQVLMSHLNDRDLTLNNSTYSWQLENANGIYFSCKLSQGSLSIHLDKTNAPSGSLSKTKDLCDDLVAVISAHPSMPYQGYDPQLFTRSHNGSQKAQLQQALRELEAARRKVKALSKKVDK